jgi:hypothetical protein
VLPAEAFKGVRIRSQADAMQMVGAIARRTNHGDVAAIYLNHDGEIVELFVFTDGAEHLDQLVYITCSPDEPEVAQLVLVTDRTGEVPADRPDDELLWMELHANAAEGATQLMDWFVTSGRYAFSVAEFAPIPAGWP